MMTYDIVSVWPFTGTTLPWMPHDCYISALPGLNATLCTGKYWYNRLAPAWMQGSLAAKVFFTGTGTHR